MTYTEKHIVATYLSLLKSLNANTKIELIQRLTKLLKKESAKPTDKFYKSFGAFASFKSAENIYTEVKASRKFRNKIT